MEFNAHLAIKPAHCIMEGVQLKIGYTTKDTHKRRSASEEEALYPEGPSFVQNGECNHEEVYCRPTTSARDRIAEHRINRIAVDL